MGGLSAEDREALSEVTGIDCHFIGRDIAPVVEQIVARRVAAALNEAADAIELSSTCTCESCDTYRDAARTVRNRASP